MGKFDMKIIQSKLKEILSNITGTHQQYVQKHNAVYNTVKVTDYTNYGSLSKIDINSVQSLNNTHNE